MPKLSTRRRAINEKVEAGKLYPAEEAFSLLKELSTVKFNETVDVAVNLGIDPRKSDQIVRGATTLPNGSGKDVRVCVFAQGDAAEAAKAAGAEFVGMDELADEVKGGMMDFDVVIAAPDAMRVVGLLGKVLGPRGLMPNQNRHCNADLHAVKMPKPVRFASALTRTVLFTAVLA